MAWCKQRSNGRRGVRRLICGRSVTLDGHKLVELHVAEIDRGNLGKRALRIPPKKESMFASAKTEVETFSLAKAARQSKWERSKGSQKDDRAGRARE